MHFTRASSAKLRDSAPVLDFLRLPPRVAQRALDDLHALAEGMRRLTGPDGDLTALLASVRVLPQTEDELSARIDALHREVHGLREWLEPLHRELTDLDDTAESLEAALAGLRGEIVPLRGELERVGAAVQGFRQEITDLRDRIPGI